MVGQYHHSLVVNRVFSGLGLGSWYFGCPAYGCVACSDDEKASGVLRASGACKQLTTSLCVQGIGISRHGMKSSELHRTTSGDIEYTACEAFAHDDQISLTMQSVNFIGWQGIIHLPFLRVLRHRWRWRLGRWAWYLRFWFFALSLVDFSFCAQPYFS